MMKANNEDADDTLRGVVVREFLQCIVHGCKASVNRIFVERYKPIRC